MGWQSSFCWLRCATFLAFAGLACFLPFVTVHLRQLGLSLSEIGSIHFVTSTTSLLGIVIAGAPVTVPGQRFVFGLTLLIAAFMGGALLLTPKVKITEHSRGLSEMICGPYGSALVRQRCGTTCDAYSGPVNFTITDCTFKPNQQQLPLGVKYFTNTLPTSTPSVFTNRETDSDQPSRGDLPLPPSTPDTQTSNDEQQEVQEPEPEVYDYENAEDDFAGEARRRRRRKRQEQATRSTQENEEYEGEDEVSVNGNVLPHVCLEPAQPDLQHNSKGYCYVFTSEMPGLTLRTPLRQHFQRDDVCYYPLTALESGDQHFRNMACRVSSADETVHCKVQEAEVQFVNETSEICHVVEGNLHLTFWLYLVLRTVGEMALIAALLLLGVLTATATRSWHWKRRQRAQDSLSRDDDFPAQEINTIQQIHQKAATAAKEDDLQMEEGQDIETKKANMGSCCGASRNPPFWWISAILGLALIGPLAGFLADLATDMAGYQACFLMGGCLLGLAVFFLAIGPAIPLPEPGSPSAEMEVNATKQTFQEIEHGVLISIPAVYFIQCNRIGRLLTNRFICLILMAMIMFGMLWGEIHTCFYWYAHDIVKSHMTLGIYLSIATLTSLILFPTLPWLVSRCGYPCIFMFGLLVYAARFLGYVLLEWNLLIAGLEALEAVTGTWMWLTGMHAVQTAAREENATTAWALALVCHFCIGRGMGSLLSALTATHLGVHAVFVGTAIICAVIAAVWLVVLYCCIKPRNKSRLRPKIYCVPSSPVRTNGLATNGATYSPLKTSRSSNSRDSTAI